MGVPGTGAEPGDPQTRTALLVVRLFALRPGRVAARVTTVDDLDAPAEDVTTSTDIEAVRGHVDAWLVATAALLAREGS